MDFSEKNPQTTEIPDYEAYVGDRWYVKVSNYGQKQYICLRQYEDKALTKSPKGNDVFIELL